MKTKRITPKQINKIFNYITGTGSLMQMPRSHDRLLGNTFDTVSSHSHHVAIIAYCLARMEGLSHQEGLKALAMGALHDNAESRTGDLNFVEKHYGKTDENLGFEYQLLDLPFAEDLKILTKEYEDRETLTSKCAKDADYIEQLYLEWMLTHMGNKLAERWFLGDKKNRVPHFRTESAKQIALLFYKKRPNDWWFEDLVEKKLNLEHLNSKR